ncbi:MAG: tRNA (N6-threonylcarbamoyladenosine(37)-N6)-methyltransferase TrmO [Desulfobacter sp.]|nr:MAG: tRNA (N6-threonylcarbamoyladenosine(37)-N6)-methyltransferase TrmO [Desulfobacter sp.]
MNSQQTISLCPVGLIHSKIKTPFLKPGPKGIKSERDPREVKAHLKELKETVSRIEIRPELSGILDGIRDYSHLVILYWAHRVPEASRSITRVHPMGRKENPEVGIFGTGSPVRPNPILTTVVKLVDREENTLSVTGLDAVDQSPVLDIKPYVRAFYPEGETRIPDWMARIIEEVNP